MPNLVIVRTEFPPETRGQEVFVRHCCRFKPDDIYYLYDNDLFSSRKLSIGFCPICHKPVAELIEFRFDGIVNKESVSGVAANDLMLSLSDQIYYSMRECNYSKVRSKPYGWKFGLNKVVKSKDKEYVKQYACDFYGNKELVKSF